VLEHTRASLGATPSAPYEVVALWPEGGPGLAADCATEAIDDIVLGGSTVQQPALLADALSCLRDGARTRSAADFHEDVFREVPVQHVDAAWLLAGGWDASDHVGDVAKRLFDVVLGVIVLVIFAPVLLVAAAAVKLGDGGPVFYSQERVGRYGRRFRILKLRTMGVGAEAGGAVWAAAGDPRATRVGRVLRRTRLDELPQVLNILAGQMSFVGPRPERPEFVESLERQVPHYAWRHLARPGLTGWAQIRLGYAASVEEARRKLECDLYYLRRRSFLLDVLILLRTAGIVPRGSR
jgi:exopolysaccharide biosynthesis polyprenyl glycosylphosphotransferase